MVRIPKIYEYATQHAEAGSEKIVKSKKSEITFLKILFFNVPGFS